MVTYQIIIGRYDLNLSREPAPVLVISVLDVLGEPVLGPVDLLTAHRHLLILEHNVEPVVLHLVFNTGVALHVTESAFFIVKVLIEQSLQVSKDCSVFRVLGYSKDLLEENIMFIIKLFVVNSKGVVPDIGFRNRVGKLSLVAKVGVLDMLNQPVLGPLDFIDIHGSIHLGQSLAEENMLLLMVLAVLPVNVLGVTDLTFLIDKVISHHVLQVFNILLAVQVIFHSSQSIKESNMLQIKSCVLK